MNYGPLIFLGVFFSLASSWFGLIFWPQTKLGSLEPVKLESNNQAYPFRSGLAERGAQVFRENGCYYCHSQQVRQTGIEFDLILLGGGTNQAATAAALMDINRSFGGRMAARITAEAKETLPKTILRGVEYAVAEKGAERLKNAKGGGKWAIDTRTLGQDISMGWGERRTVALDFAIDHPVMLGSLRQGPDLANAGRRIQSPSTHFLHLYNPTVTTFGLEHKSTMPPYPFLFDVRKVDRTPSPARLRLPRDYVPGEGLEVVPGPDAQALAAYLLSLKRDVSLPIAPATSPYRDPESVETSAPAGGGGGGKAKGGKNGGKKKE